MEYISLEYPSKKELIEKERIFEQEVDNQPSKTTKGLSDKHQIAAIAFKTSVHVLRDLLMQWQKVFTKLLMIMMRKNLAGTGEFSESETKITFMINYVLDYEFI